MGKQKESNKKYAKISEKVKSIIILEKKQFNWDGNWKKSFYS